MWYELKDISASSKKYRVSQTEMNSVVNNNFYMIMGGSEVNDRMHRIIGESSPVLRGKMGQGPIFRLTYNHKPMILSCSKQFQ